MKTFLKLVAIIATAEVVLSGVAWLVVNYSSHVKEIELCMIYGCGILTTLGMGCMATNPESKLGKSLFILLFVGIHCMIQSLVIFAMLH